MFDALNSATASPATHGTGRRVALVVGVNHGPEAERSELRYAEADATAIAAKLEGRECGFTVRSLLLGEAADSSKIQHELLVRLEELNSEDLLLFYFSGHGYAKKLSDGDVDYEDIYLVTRDFNPRIAGSGIFLSVNWLRAKVLESTTVGGVVLLLDCCYAGGIDKPAMDPSWAGLRNWLLRNFDIRTTTANNTAKMRIVMCATTAVGRAWERDGHSLFTATVLDALSGGAAYEGGVVTAYSIQVYIEGHAERWPGDTLPGLHGGGRAVAFWLAHYGDRGNLCPAESSVSDEGKTRLRVMLSDHSGIMNSRLADFVGRKQELKDIRQHIQEIGATGGYVTITGQAGQGKSSILAKLVAEDAAKISDTNQDALEEVVHHFIPLSPGPDYHLVILRDLMARLILKYGLSDVYVADDTVAALTSSFPKVLANVAASGRQETIYIDGVDQLRSMEGSDERDLSFLPIDPPPGVVFVLGTRPDSVLQSLKRLKPHGEYDLPDLSHDDFDTILRRRNIQLTRLLADTFYATTEGNALYLNLAAELLAQTSPDQAEDIIEQIADDPKGLFKLSIMRLKRQPSRWGEVIRPVLGVLLAAREPLGFPALRKILERIDSDALHDGLQSLGGLVTRSKEGRYSLFHRKFAEYLHQDGRPGDDKGIFDADEMRGFHAQLARWCEVNQGDVAVLWDDKPTDAAEQARRDYARQHYTTHLYRSKEWNRLYAILDDAAYRRGKVEHDPSTLTFLQDLALGQEAITREEDFETGVRLLPQLWNYGFMRCQRASQANYYPETLFSSLALLGRKEEAEGIAELVTDESRKSRVLLETAKCLGEPMCSQMLLRAYQVARGIDNHAERIQRLLAVAAAIAAAKGSAGYQADILREAAEATRLIADRTEQVGAALSVVVAMLSAERSTPVARLLREVAGTARSVTDEAERGWARFMVSIVTVRTAARAQRYGIALRGLDRIVKIVPRLMENDVRRVRALAAVATAIMEEPGLDQARSRLRTLLDQATAMARAAENAAERVGGLVTVADATASASDWVAARGLLREAASAAREADSAHLRDGEWLLSSVVTALCEGAETAARSREVAEARYLLADAIKIGRAMGDSRGRVSALAAIAHARVTIAESLVQLGRLGKAVQMLLSREGYERWPMQAAAEAARANDDDREERAQNLIALVTICCRVSEVLVQAGEAEQGRVYLHRTADEAHAIDDQYGRWPEDLIAVAEALGGIAGTWTRLKDASEAAQLVKEAMEIVGSIDDKGERAWALAALAYAMQQGDDLALFQELQDQAFGILRESSADTYVQPWIYGLNSIADILEQRGDTAAEAQLLRAAAVAIEMVGVTVGTHDQAGEDGNESSDRPWLAVLATVAAALSELDLRKQLLPIIRHAWVTASTRGRILALFPLAMPLLPARPPVRRDFADIFNGVESFS